MNPQLRSTHPRASSLRSSRRCCGSALTQTLLICLVVFFGAASAVFILRSGGKAPAAEAQAEKAEGKDKEKDKHDDKGEQHGAKGRVEMTPEKLKQAHLGIVDARPAKIHVNLRVFGKVVPNEEKLAHVSPRFPGIAKKVNKRLGESVNAGEVLATVESNESLQGYDLKASLSGTIIERDVTVGEFVGTDKSLFTVADLSTVWVDFQIYQQDFPKLQTGQPVRIAPGARIAAPTPGETPPPLAEKPGSVTSEGTTADGHSPARGGQARNEIVSRIDYLSPFGAESTQTMLARAYVSNPNGALRPGLFVSGEIAVDEVNAAVAVPEDAVQTLDGKEVVFVEEGDSFEARPVQIGQRDGERVEVLSGLQPGERYVAVNSFLLKAELGKEGAEHED